MPNHWYYAYTIHIYQCLSFSGLREETVVMIKENWLPFSTKPNKPFHCHLIPILKTHYSTTCNICHETLWWSVGSSYTTPRLVCFKWQASSYVLIKCTHTDRPASIMDLPSSLSCNEWDLKQRRMVPASQTLNTQMAQIAYAAPETEETEVVPEKVKITLNTTRKEGKHQNNM